MLVLALDPGSVKCGLALVDGDGSVVDRAIVQRATLESDLSSFLGGRTVDVVVVGNGTTGRAVADRLTNVLPGVARTMIDEDGSTLEGREIWVAEGSRGWFGRLPAFLRRMLAPAALDDFAAVALARRHLARST